MLNSGLLNVPSAGGGGGGGGGTKATAEKVTPKLAACDSQLTRRRLKRKRTRRSRIAAELWNLKTRPVFERRSRSLRSRRSPHKRRFRLEAAGRRRHRHQAARIDRPFGGRLFRDEKARRQSARSNEKRA